MRKAVVWMYKQYQYTTLNTTQIMLFLAGALQSLPIGSGYFEIVCNANPNDLTSAIRWTKNGKPFNLNPQNPYVYFTRDRRKIIFENLSPADNGIYTCYLNDTDVSSASTDLFIENASKLYCIIIFPSSTVMME